MTADEDAVDALVGYGIGPSDIECLEPLPRGIKNLNHRVRAGGEDWVLKRHPGSVDAARLAVTHAFEARLATAGLPVARIRPPSAGGTVVTIPAGVYTMHSWVHGRHIGIDQREQAHAEHPQLARRLGALVGQLHREGLPSDHTGAGAALSVEALLAGPGRTMASIQHGRPHRFRKVARLRRRPRNSLDDWALEHLPDLARHARALSSSALARAVDGSDIVLAHNDLNWENLVLGDDLEVLAVLDFDNACLLPRALDLGAAAVVLVGSDERRLDDFLQAYADAAGREVDCAAVLIGMRWKSVRSMLWSIDSYASGRTADPGMVEVWCRHLHACLTGLPDGGAPGVLR